MTRFDDFLKAQLKDPEVKREYEVLQPEFEMIQAMIDARKMHGYDSERVV